MVASSEAAVPYSERRGSDELYRTSYYSDNVGLAPAAAMNSSVDDLSRWLIAIMNGGVYNGTRVIPRSVIRETLAPAIALPNTELESNGWSEMLNSTYGMGRWTAVVSRTPDCVPRGDHPRLPVAGVDDAERLDRRDRAGDRRSCRVAPQHRVVERLRAAARPAPHPLVPADGRHSPRIQEGERDRARRAAKGVAAARSRHTHWPIMSASSSTRRTAISRSREPTDPSCSASTRSGSRCRTFTTSVSTRLPTTRTASGR